MSTYKKFMLLAIIFYAGEFLIIPIMRPLINIWIGADALPNISILTSVLFAILGCLMILNSILSSIANGMGDLKIQTICFMIILLNKRARNSSPLFYKYFLVTAASSTATTTAICE